MAHARAEWQGFMAAAPAYPERVFSGRGIVILAGGPKYLVPAWVGINMLRRTGKLLGALCSVLVHCLVPLRWTLHLCGMAVRPSVSGFL